MFGKPIFGGKGIYFSSHEKKCHLATTLGGLFTKKNSLTKENAISLALLEPKILSSFRKVQFSPKTPILQWNKIHHSNKMRNNEFLRDIYPLIKHKMIKFFKESGQ